MNEPNLANHIAETLRREWERAASVAKIDASPSLRRAAQHLEKSARKRYLAWCERHGIALLPSDQAALGPAEHAEEAA